MYNFKVINMGIPDKTFNESCFFAVSDVKFKLGNNSYIPTELKEGVFCCNGNSKENLSVMITVKEYLTNKRYIEGIDFTINVLMEN